MIRRACAAVVLGLVLAGCSDGSAGPEPASEPSAAAPSSSAAAPSPSAAPSSGAPVGPQYVALGDSYAAAPGVPETDSAGGCFRSSGNYAQLLAAAEGLEVTDATCSGATSQTVLSDQVPAVTPETELVTVGVGGNDFGLFVTLLRDCLGAAASGSGPGGSPCTDAVGDRIDRTLPRISANVGRVLDAVVAAAPDAQVVVVGYPTLLPASGSCPDRVPLAPGDYPLVNEVTAGLSRVLRTEAERRDLEFLDLAGPSRGHDICSAEPWVNGGQVAPDGTIPFHPFAAEQEAVAGLVAELR